ncbi:hypothetical protein EDC02_7641 [Micromonospora sp. Llam0]|uniref:hypothetical protein n=1 Tax=Micromonospora sp. Llam0 TaxID=2485143 RepID=UPI000FB4F191|nr:hypothetical protein [Micromonospora sp. Llam0]ROO52701.1 hypothetical protein EDC02_7641 [Micromonospora sp. Llam0]
METSRHGEMAEETARQALGSTGTGSDPVAAGLAAVAHALLDVASAIREASKQQTDFQQ